MLLELLDELQEKVLEYTDVVSLNNLSVCSSNYTALCRPFLWRNLKIPPHYMCEFGDDENLMEKLDTEHFQHTKSLRLTYDDFFLPVWTDSLLENTRKLLAKCNHLSVLHTCFSLPVKLWEGLDHLREVCLSHEASTDECVVALCNAHPHLRSLTVEEPNEGLFLDFVDGDCIITSAGFANVSACVPFLVELCLDGCTDLDDDSVKIISALRSLKHLSLSRCHRITTRSLPYIGSLQQLERVDITHCRRMKKKHEMEMKKMLAHVKYLEFQE